LSAAILDPAVHDAPRDAFSSPAARWTGRILTGIAILFLAFDAGIKLSGAKQAVDGTVQLGWQPHHVPIIGTIALVLLILYVIPRTAPLGAILWTGYFGGAIATQLRVDNPLFSYILVPIYIAAIMWGGLYLRDARVRALLRPAR
jgi:DoxX-like protein